MKKYFILMFVLTFIITLTGCGKNVQVLDCTKNDTDSGFETVQNIKATFDGDNITNVTATANIIIGETYKNYKSMILDNFSKELNKYDKFNGIKVSTGETEEGAKIVISADLGKMDDKSKAEFNIIDTTGNYENTKEQMIKDGYACK